MKPILHEIHETYCTCSYCHGGHAMRFGLNIPKRWNAWHSWYVIKYGNGKYVRWTFSFLKRFLKTKDDSMSLLSREDDTELTGGNDV